MKIFTLNLKYLFAVVFLLFFLGASAQIRIYEEGSYIKAEINEEQKEEIMAASTNILNQYIKVASFRDENDNFSDDSYTEFVGLFSGSAEVYNDLVKKDAQNINYASYADNVFQYMQGTGVKFELNETYLDEITYDSSGFYVVNLSFEKIMFNGLDEDFEIVNYPNNGKSIDLKMKIEIPEYDLSDASIVGITGEAAKVKVESANMISADFNYHLGNVLKTATILSPGWTDDLPVAYNSFGVDVVYRRSLNNKKSLYFLIGASLAFNNFNTDLVGYRGELPTNIGVDYGGDAVDALGNPVSGSESSNITVLDQGNTLNEQLQVIDVQVPLGVSLRILEAYNYDFFVDLAVVPTYSISSSGSYSGNLSFLNIPSNIDRFGQQLLDALDQDIADGTVDPAYVGSINYDNELVEVANQFSAAAQITPLFHYKFNFNMALELGLNVSYNFLPYFANETNHLGNGERVELIDLTSIAGAQNPSVLQNNYRNVGLIRYGARIGIVFKL